MLFPSSILLGMNIWNGFTFCWLKAIHFKLYFSVPVWSRQHWNLHFLAQMTRLILLPKGNIKVIINKKKKMFTSQLSKLNFALLTTTNIYFVMCWIRYWIDFLFVPGHSNTIHDIAVWENFLITASEDQKIIRFDINSCKVIKEYNGHSKGVQVLRLFHPKGGTSPLLYSGSYDNTVITWDFEVYLPY